MLFRSSGKIQPETEIKISSDVSGEITELFVKEGQRVKKGTLLCRIKPDNYESMLQRAEASVKSTQAGLKSSKAMLDQAKAGFENARLNFERQRKLFDLKLISNQEYELALNQYLSAEANMKSVESNVLSASYGIEGNEATLKEARAEGEANRLKTQSLNSLLIQMKLAESWDGKLPQYGQTPTLFKDIAK